MANQYPISRMSDTAKGGFAKGFSSFFPGSGMIRATSCTLRLGTGWTWSAPLWTRPGPRLIMSSTSSTSCRQGSRRTAARSPGRPTLSWLATSPHASAVSPSSSRSSRPTCGAMSSRACTTITSSVRRKIAVVRVGRGSCYDCKADFWLCLSVFVYCIYSLDWAAAFNVISFKICVQSAWWLDKVGELYR